jgi:hypothetical protein
VPAQQRAATTQTPRRPIGAGGARGASRSGSVSTNHHTRSLCAQSPAQSEQWCCWFWIGRNRGNLCLTAMPLDGQHRRTTLAEDPGSTRPEQHFPSGAAQTRTVSVAIFRLDPRKSVRSFKGIICGDISEFESHMPSQAVGLCEPILPHVPAPAGNPKTEVRFILATTCRSSIVICSSFTPKS